MPHSQPVAPPNHSTTRGPPPPWSGENKSLCPLLFSSETEGMTDLLGLLASTEPLLLLVQEIFNERTQTMFSKMST